MWPQPSYQEASLSWLPVYNANSMPPPNAVEAQPGLYVIRGREGNDVLPGKWPQANGKGYIPFGGEEKEISVFEVLCCTALNPHRMNYNWMPAYGGQVPNSALKAGQTDSGEPLFVARGLVNGEMCIGKVHRSHMCAYFPWGGTEHKHENYDVLCYMP